MSKSARASTSKKTTSSSGPRQAQLLTAGSFKSSRPSLSSDPKKKKFTSAKSPSVSAPVKEEKKGNGVVREELDEKSARWDELWGWAREKMDGAQPIHTEHQSKVDHILRIFDLSYEYGPSVGLTRLQRFERAEEMELDPPAGIKDILLTKQGVEDPRLRETVFYGRV